MLKWKKKFNKNQTKFAQVPEIPNNAFKITLVKKSSRTEVHHALILPILPYGSEIWTLRKKDKKLLTSIEMNTLRTTGYPLFNHKRNEEFREEMKVEPVDEKLRRYKSELATKCNKTEQQQDAKNNAEL